MWDWKMRKDCEEDIRGLPATVKGCVHDAMKALISSDDLDECGYDVQNVYPDCNGMWLRVKRQGDNRWRVFVEVREYGVRTRPVGQARTAADFRTLVFTMVAERNATTYDLARMRYKEVEYA